MKAVVASVLALTELASLSSAVAISPRDYKFKGSSCSEDQQNIVELEMAFALNMADAATGINGNDPYYKQFFSQDHQDLDFYKSAKTVFKQMKNMLDPDNSDYTIQVTCDDSTTGCSKKGWVAHMNDNTATMNFCSKFFNPPDGVDKAIQATETRTNDCDNLDLRQAQWSRSSVIIHECAHTEYAMDQTSKALDYAYGYTSCVKMARGEFDRSCVSYKTNDGNTTPLCPSDDDPSKEGICPEDLEMKNADTWSFVATGIYFSKFCKRQIPLPDLASKRRRSNVFERATCDPSDTLVYGGIE